MNPLLLILALATTGSLASAELYGPEANPTPPAPVKVDIKSMKKVRNPKAVYEVKGTASANAMVVQVAVGEGKAAKKFNKAKGTTTGSYKARRRPDFRARENLDHPPVDKRR